MARERLVIKGEAMALSRKATMMAGVSAVCVALVAGWAALSWKPNPQAAEAVMDAVAGPLSADAGPPLSAEEALSVEAQEIVPTAPESAPPEAAEATAVAPPKITTWFVGEDGAATIAGEAAPAALVRVTLDDAPLAQVVATGGGEFAMMAQLPPNPAPSVLKVAMELPTGEIIVSDVIVVIGPVASAADEIATAAAAPEAQPLDADLNVRGEEEPATGLALAGAQPLALAVSPEGVALLGMAAEPSELRLAAISYPSPEIVAMQGQAPAESLVRVYLDNTLRRETRVGAAGEWALEFDDIAPALYTLRVDAVDGQGVVIARLEMPFQRETIEALAAFSGPEVVEDALVQAAGAEVVQTLGETAFEEVATAEALGEAQALTPVDRLTRGAVADVSGAGTGTGTTATQTPSGETVTITVQPGHSLWAIARDQFGDGVLYVQVYEANKDAIRDPDLIYPGQVFVLPKP